MRRLPAALLACALLGTPRLDAQQSSATKAAPDFGPLEFLVGSCWIGEFPGGKQTDEHCFEWVFDRKFIRDRHVVRGGKPYEGETIYAWDAKENRVAFWYWNSDGDLTTGHAEYTPEGIVFPERYDTPDGVVELRAVWTRTGDDGYRVLQTRRTGDDWKTLWTMELKRKR